MSPFRTFTAHLVRSASLSELTKHLEFELPGEKLFGFVAGQWLSCKQLKPDGEEITRAYSLCSPPADNNRFALCLNRVQDGFLSNFFCDMEQADEILSRAPFSDSIFPPPLSHTTFSPTAPRIPPSHP